MSDVTVKANPRGQHVVIGAMGLALVVLAWLVVTVEHQANVNGRALRVVEQSLRQARAELSAQQRLVRGLQRQVRECHRHPHRAECAHPLTVPPTTRTPPRTTAPPTGPVASSTPASGPTPTPRPTRTPRPTPSPTPQPSPTRSPRPSPSPTPCSLAHPLKCLPGG